MIANSKTVVMAKVTNGKSVRIAPLAVFARSEQAAPYGRAVRDAVKAGDEVKLTGLILEAGIPANEFIGADVKLSAVSLRYCPTVGAEADDPFADDAPPKE